MSIKLRFIAPALAGGAIAVAIAAAPNASAADVRTCANVGSATTCQSPGQRRGPHGAASSFGSTDLWTVFVTTALLVRLAWRSQRIRGDDELALSSPRLSTLRRRKAHRGCIVGSLAGRKHLSRAANSVDQRFLPGVNLLAQQRDVPIEDARLAAEIILPIVTQYLVPTDSSRRLPH
jgi:hypothetical protein